MTAFVATARNFPLSVRGRRIDAHLLILADLEHIRTAHVVSEHSEPYVLNVITFVSGRHGRVWNRRLRRIFAGMCRHLLSKATSLSNVRNISPKGSVVISSESIILFISDIICFNHTLVIFFGTEISRRGAIHGF